MKSILVTGARIWTGTDSQPFAESLLVVGNRFAAVGSAEEVQAHPRARDAFRIELGGEGVVPGFTDAHVHLAGLARQNWEVSLEGSSSLEEAFGRIRERAASVGPGDWIYAVGFDETRWPDARKPTRADVDALGLSNPVLLRRICAHVHVAGSHAMERARLFRESGVFLESEVQPLTDAMARESQGKALSAETVLEACRKLASWGTTCVHTCSAASYGLEEDLSLYQELFDRGLLPLRVVSYHDALPNILFRSGYGNDWIRYGGLKLFLDGSLGGRSAALAEDYADAPGHRGRLNLEDADLASAVEEAFCRGIQVQVHAIGDAAIDQALDAFEPYAGRKSPLAFPFRLNHVIVTREDTFERLARIRPACDIQPIQAVSDMDMAPLRLGPGRSRTAYAWKTLENLGLLLTGSSDGPVDTANLWVSVDAAVNRRKVDGSGQSWREEERLCLDSALRLFTVNPWRVIGQDRRIGRIAPGMAADFCILDRDPFAIPAEDLHEVTVLGTFAGGTLTSDRSGDLGEPLLLETSDPFSVTV